jgi:signal transduction histidine kinase
MIDARTAFILAGFLFVALPATTWSILHRRHDRRSVATWCTGSLLYGFGFILLGLRDAFDARLAFGLGNLLVFLSYPLRAAALLRELGDCRPNLPRLALPWLVASTIYLGTLSMGGLQSPPLAVSLLANLAGAAWLAWLAWTLHRRNGSRSAAMLAWTDALFAAALAVRLVAVASEWQSARAFAGSVDLALALVSSVIASLYGNLGYIGIALESTRRQDLTREAELAREQERRMQTELRLQEQATAHEERGRLLAQREEMLAMMAHEVRQPLNNASAALQSAAEAVADEQRDRRSTAVRLQRASTVLSQITTALDNTLADAVLLNDVAPLARQDIDIDTLVNLALADVEPAERHRLRIERATGTRTASMHAGLIRLALRNLIANALAYAPSNTPVTVRIADSDEPLALVLDVIDQGGGIPDELRPRLFTRGARGTAPGHRHGHGLGLYIVHRVMTLHGGEVRVRHPAVGGLAMALVIPQSFDE